MNIKKDRYVCGKQVKFTDCKKCVKIPNKTVKNVLSGKKCSIDTLLMTNKCKKSHFLGVNEKYENIKNNYNFYNNSMVC